MKKNKNIPPRNYLIVFFLCLAAIFVTIYIFQWKEYNENELTSKSYLVSTSTVSLIINTLDELETTLFEKPNNLFIYTGYTGDIDEYYLEEDLKSIIDDYSLADQFYYLDITNLLDDEDFLNDLSNVLSTEISSYPVIIYISDDEVINKIDSDDEIIEANDFLKLLEIYEFEKSN